MPLLPPCSTVPDVLENVRRRGYALIAPLDVAGLAGASLDVLRALESDWTALPPDAYLKDGGRYRRRRHSCVVVDGDAIIPVAHRAHWQSEDYNALHGGMERWFEAFDGQTLGNSALQSLLRELASWCSRLKGQQPWFVELHQFRIDTTDGIGRPTPEGAHRDGVDFVAVFVVAREGIKGGETRVFQADGPDGQRFTLDEPWSLLFLDDEQVIHESTPIQPLDRAGHRDTLVVTFRAGAFQGPENP